MGRRKKKLFEQTTSTIYFIPPRQRRGHRPRLGHRGRSAERLVPRVGCGFGRELGGSRRRRRRRRRRRKARCGCGCGPAELGDSRLDARARGRLWRLARHHLAGDTLAIFLCALRRRRWRCQHLRLEGGNLPLRRRRWCCSTGRCDVTILIPHYFTLNARSHLSRAAA